MSTNKVRQIRTKLSLSQRELAERAGTSQQQIQRIEAGTITTNLPLANSICRVLGKPLDVVFPKAAQALRELQKEMEESHSVTDEALERAADEGIEADASRWTFKVILKGHNEPLFFPISASEKRRLYSAIQDEDAGSLVQFGVFDTEDHRVAVNLGEVSFCQFLFDSPHTIDRRGDVQENGGVDVLIVMAGGGSGIGLSVDIDDTSDGDDLGQLGHIFYMMGCEADPSDRYRIVDVDGEHAFVRAGSIALLKVALWALGEGGHDDESEDVM